MSVHYSSFVRYPQHKFDNPPGSRAKKNKPGRWLHFHPPGFRRHIYLSLLVAVHPRQKRIDADVGKEHRDEPDNRKDRRRTSVPAPAYAKVQVDRVDQPGDERPCLLRVPGPVTAPGALRPDRPGQDAEREEQEPERHRAVADEVQLLLGRHVAVKEPLVLHALPHQENDTQHERDPESAVGDDRRGDVEAQPVALQSRHEVVHFLALHGRIADDQENDRRRKRAQHMEPVPDHEDQAHEAEAPGEARCELVLVRERQAACADPAEDQGDRVQHKARPLKQHRNLSHVLLLRRHKDEVGAHREEVEHHDDGEEYIFNSQIIHLKPPS